MVTHRHGLCGRFPTDQRQVGHTDRRRLILKVCSLPANWPPLHSDLGGQGVLRLGGPAPWNSGIDCEQSRSGVDKQILERTLHFVRRQALALIGISTPV
jgi:hypothetical protein